MIPPKVSIITPLHNKGAYISETIASVLAQTREDWEMIVVENGSTDHGPDVVRSFQDPRVQLITSVTNGPGAARNYGLSKARGEWILFLDADDLLKPRHLENFLSCMKEKPEATLIVARWIEFSESDPSERVMVPAGWMQGRQEVLDFAIFCAPWALHAALISRKLLGSGAAWNDVSDRYPSEDSAFWFPVIRSATIAWSQCLAVLYRKETSNSRNAHPDIGRWIDGLLLVIRRNVEVLDAHGETVNSRQIRNILKGLEEKYWIAHRTGQNEAAKRCLDEAERWLRRSTWNAPGLILRHLFGIHSSLVLEKLLQRIVRSVTNPSPAV
jgi:glycosyltransferase involved in cell wall biosynthesis